MTLSNIWFFVIAVLWTGFFVLEGFDFGVGMLHGVVGKTETERVVAISAIGPLWDGNEVWLIVAGAGMFAAFPGWYATMFSGFYIAMLVLLAALIVRGVSFEYRGKRESPKWRRNWDRLMTAGSLLAPFLIGVAFGNLLHGVPIAKNQEFAGSFVDLLNPYSLWVGVTLVTLCVFHGATFLSLKTEGDVRDRSATIAGKAGPIAGAAVVIFGAWTLLGVHATASAAAFFVLAVVAVAVAHRFAKSGQDGRAFLATAVAIGATVLALFSDLFPKVMVSSTNAAYDLTVSNTSSSAYTLKVMTVVAVIFLPLVLLYQGWTYYVFRKRIGAGHVKESAAAATDAVADGASAGTGSSSPAE
jgi:cytochrome d ubiquinol oxidase subunit II